MGHTFCTLSPQGDDALPALEQLLGHIEEGAVLPPLVVVQALASNKSLKVGACLRCLVCILCWRLTCCWRLSLVSASLEVP